MDDISAYLSHFEFHRAAIVALIQIILIDLTLAGDNSLVIGMTANRVAEHHRRLVIFLGLLVALVVRIALALIAVKLLGLVGAKFVGGVILLWVSGHLYQGIVEGTVGAAGTNGQPEHAGLLRAVMLIVIADISMAFDNVLAVAGIAQPLMATDPWILFVGLALSVALMGIAASFIAGVLRRVPWIGFVGVALVAFVAIRMIVEGGVEILNALHH